MIKNRNAILKIKTLKIQCLPIGLSAVRQVDRKIVN